MFVFDIRTESQLCLCLTLELSRAGHESRDGGCH